MNFQPLKSHSFQVQQINQNGIFYGAPQTNQLAMTFDASMKNASQVPKRDVEVPKIPELMQNRQMMGQDFVASGPGMGLYPPGAYGSPQPGHMYMPKQQKLPAGMSFQQPASKLNMTVMDTLNSNNSLNRSANHSLNNSYNIEPMSDFNNKFNHSMNIGGPEFNKPGLINPPPGLTKFDGGVMGYRQVPQYGGQERMMQPPPSNYYQMNPGMGMGSYPSPPPPINQPPMSLFCPPAG